MQDLHIDTDFPGGNAVLDTIDGDTVCLHPDLRDTEGNWFYWAFRVRGAAARTLTFQFTAQDPMGVRGPAVSLDEGVSWRWLGNPSGSVNSFQYRFPACAWRPRSRSHTPIARDLRSTPHPPAPLAVIWRRRCTPT